MKYLFLLLFITSCAVSNVSQYSLRYSVDSTVSYMGTDFPKVETFLMKYNKYNGKHEVVLRAVAGGFISKETMVQEYQEALRDR